MNTTYQNISSDHKVMIILHTKFKSNVPPLKTTDMSDVVNDIPRETLAESKDHKDLSICK